MTGSELLELWALAGSAPAGWLAAAIALGTALWLRWRLGRVGALVVEASHELRNPLCAARLALAVVDDSRGAPAGPLMAVDSALARAGLAIDDLTAALALRRTEGTVEVLDATDFVRDTYASWRAPAAACGVELTLSLPERGEALAVRADRRRLQQGYGNLISNALEHGGPQVRLRLHAAAGRVWLGVEDRGDGLPDRLDRIVGRGRGSLRPRGHGLAIADRVAREGDGRLLARRDDGWHRMCLDMPVADSPRARLIPRLSHGSARWVGRGEVVSRGELVSR